MISFQLHELTDLISDIIDFRLFVTVRKCITYITRSYFHRLRCYLMHCVKTKPRQLQFPFRFRDKSRFSSRISFDIQYTPPKKWYARWNMNALTLFGCTVCNVLEMHGNVMQHLSTLEYNVLRWIFFLFVSSPYKTDIVSSLQQQDIPFSHVEYSRYDVLPTILLHFNNLLPQIVLLFLHGVFLLL